jgi:hypothetical protein
MKIEKLRRGVMCVGAIRLLPIDFGFDPKLHGAIDISRCDDYALADISGKRDQTGVGYEAKDGSPRQVWGTRDEIAIELARSGFTVIAARTPNGREVRCEKKRPTVFICQPPNDNFWNDFDSIGAALAQFDK